MTRILIIVVALLASIAGCAASPAVAIGERGLQHNNCDLSIGFRDATGKWFINEKWLIENWTYDPKTQLFRLRTGPQFEGRVNIDLDGDGRPESETTNFTDLELLHKEHSARIWVITRELPLSHASTNVDVFLRMYAESLSGTGFELRRGPIDFVDVTARTFATKVSDVTRTRLGPWDAIIATIEIANLEQLRLDPNHRVGTIRVLIARIDPFAPTFAQPFYTGGRSGKGLLMVGYFNTPDYFNEDLKDFSAFVEQLMVAGQRIQMTSTAEQPAAIEIEPSHVDQPEHDGGAAVTEAPPAGDYREGSGSDPASSTDDSPD